LNKADLVYEDKLVKTIDFLSFKPQEQVIATYLTSAKNGSQVDRIFEKLAHAMIKPE
jgi:hypothetical protein